MKFYRYIIISLLLHLAVIAALSWSRPLHLSLEIRGGEVSLFLESGDSDGGPGSGKIESRGRDLFNENGKREEDGEKGKTSGADGDGDGNSGGVYGAVGRFVSEAYRNNPPEYPAIARAMGYQGRVTLLLEVLPDGRCGSVDITKSSGHRVLDLAAQRAAKGWVFFTEKSFALASPVRVSQDIIFMLKTY